MTATSPRPALSIVVISFNSTDSLERCLMSLVGQAAAHNAELLVVRAARSNDDRETVRGRFDRCRWIAALSDETIPQMRTRGLAAANSPIVALLEDDCVVDPGWCAAMLEAHRGPWIAIGGAVEPDNYRRLSDWAVYFYEFGRFMLPFEPHQTGMIPGNNVSYKTEALIADDASAAGGFYDFLIHQGWARAGKPMGVTPAAIVQNRNSWPLSYLTIASFHHGRGFAAMRAAGLSVRQRGGLALLVPVLPLLQLWRIIQQTTRRKRALDRLILAVPWIVVFGTSWAAGEWFGYLFGPGRSPQRWR